MTTYSHTIELDDSEWVTVVEALAMLKEECDLQIAKKQGAPYRAHLRSIVSIKKKLDSPGQQMSGNSFAVQVEPASETERKPQSEFFTARLIDQGELPWVEIRALASIGAGLLMRHLGDRKAIDKLARLAVSFDSVHHNMTAKAMSNLLDDAAGGPYDPTEQDWADLAQLAGYKPEEWERLLAESRGLGK